MPKNNDPVCLGCRGATEDCDGLVKKDGNWWCADCWDVMNDPTLDIERAEEERRQRIIDKMEAE